MAVPAIPLLSASQLATLAAAGEERTAGVGDVRFRVGDATYPFIEPRETTYAIRRASCVRDFTPSLRNTLRRWYSTVLGLMNN
jgi:hypothetical protein